MCAVFCSEYAWLIRDENGFDTGVPTVMHALLRSPLVYANGYFFRLLCSSLTVRLRILMVTVLLLVMTATPSLLLGDEHQLDANFSLSQDAHTVGERTTTYSLSPVNGWTTGGEEITITGTGFLDMAYKNVTSDGEAYIWTTNTINYVTGAGYSPSVVVDSNGTVHIVHMIWSDDELWHSTLTAGSTTCLLYTSPSPRDS